jgi:hypothetical protein
MSLTTRILFASSMLACAALCGWAAVSFGGPGTTAMWGMTGVCTLVAVVVWMIKAKAPMELENVRVEGAREPTFRLIRSEPSVKGEIWQLVLGNTHCTLIRPDGAPATTFDRKWAGTAITLPGFISGEMRRIVKEDWSPPDEERPFTHDLAEAARSIRPSAAREADYYWFSPSKEVIQEIEDYKKRTFTELGSEATGPLLIKARQCIVSGLVGLAAGIALLGYRFMSTAGQAPAPGNSGSKAIAFAGVISVIGMWRIGQGIIHYTQVRRIVSEAGKAPRVG